MGGIPGQNTSPVPNGQSPQPIMGAVQLLLLVVLLGIIVGLGIRYLRVGSSVPVPGPEGQKAGRTEGQRDREPEGSRDRTPEGQKDAGSLTPQVVEVEEKRARVSIEQGEQALLRMDFAAARKLFDEVAGLRAAPETLQRARQQAQRAGAFDLAIAHVQISEFAKAETAWALDVQGGQRVRGLLVDEQPDVLTLVRVSEENPAAAGTVRLSIPVQKIEKRRAVSLAERQKEFLGLLERLEKAQLLGPAARAEDYYDLVVLSKRLGLGAKCVEYLDAAYEKAPRRALGELFRQRVIDRAVERATLLAAVGRRIQAEAVLRELTRRTLPGYDPAVAAEAAFRREVLARIKDDFQSTLALESAPAGGEATAKTAQELASAATTNEGAAADGRIGLTGEGPSSSNAKADEFVQRANRLYREGLAEYGKFRQGTNGDNNAVLKRAAEKLGEAVDLYGQALDLDPKNKAIENRQVEANMIYYGAKIKNPTL